MEVSTHLSAPSTGGMNAVLSVHINTANPVTPSLVCTLNLEPGYSCTIDYGTDPSYANLVYSDTSTTLGQVATITLSQELQRDTTYYFIVSAQNTSQCVRVRGTFQTGGQVNSCVWLAQR